MEYTDNDLKKIANVTLLFGKMGEGTNSHIYAVVLEDDALEKVARSHRKNGNKRQVRLPNHTAVYNTKTGNTWKIKGYHSYGKEISGKEFCVFTGKQISDSEVCSDFLSKLGPGCMAVYSEWLEAKKKGEPFPNTNTAVLHYKSRDNSLQQAIHGDCMLAGVLHNLEAYFGKDNVEVEGDRVMVRGVFSEKDRDLIDKMLNSPSPISMGYSTENIKVECSIDTEDKLVSLDKITDLYEVKPPVVDQDENKFEVKEPKYGKQERRDRHLIDVNFGSFKQG